MSSEANAVGSRSETTDGTAGQANVMPTAVEIGEALLARAITAKSEARRMVFISEASGERERAIFHRAQYWAFADVLYWIDAIKADAATLTREERSPTS